MTRRHIAENSYDTLKFRKRLYSFHTVCMQHFHQSCSGRLTATTPHGWLIAETTRCHDVTELTRVTQPLPLYPSSAAGRADLMAPLP